MVKHKMMNDKEQSIATSPHQSARLIACGVDSNSADMCWTLRTHRIDGSPIKKSHQKANLWIGYPCKRILTDDEQRTDIPAWSLGTLISLMPIELTWQGLYYRLVMGPNKDRWEIEYNDLSVLNNAHRVIADTPIEACVQMIEWLNENKSFLNYKKCNNES